MDQHLDLRLPKGCRLGTRSDGSTRILPPLAKIENSKMGSRTLTREEFESLDQKPPEQTHQQFKDTLEGNVRDDEAIAREYRGTFLLKMRELAKDLTAESGFSDQAIECWESGIDELVAQTARFI